MKQHEAFWGGLMNDLPELIRNQYKDQWLHDKRHEARERGVQSADPLTVNTDEWHMIVRKFKAWKVPGPDGIRNIWWKRLYGAKEALRQMVLELCNGVQEIPDWLCEGRTVLIPKSANPSGPNEFRPIACLNTIYKARTAVMAKRLMTHVVEHKILPESQRALKSTRGTLDCLLRDEAIALDAKSRGKDLVVTWIDLKKAYDKVPHSWVKKAMKAISMPRWWNRTLKKIMNKWATRLEIRTGKRSNKRKVLSIKHGVMQGDGLAPSLFAIAIAPLSTYLETTRGYLTVTGRNMTHQFFVDDLKTYSERQETNDATRGVDEVARSIGMELG